MKVKHKKNKRYYFFMLVISLKIITPWFAPTSQTFCVSTQGKKNKKKCFKVRAKTSKNIF